MNTVVADRPAAANAAAKESGPDLEKIPVAQVFSQLHVDPGLGLTGAEATKRLDQYGPNALVEKEQSLLSKILGYFMGPIAYMIEAAAIVSAILGHWEDFIIIAALLVFNCALDLWQDLKAANALAALKKGLAPEATALRDGKWGVLDAAATLVPGDIVKIRLGVIVPADLRMVSGDYASIDQAALTGELLPVAKKVDDEAYSGSVVKQGEMEGVVIATGSNTFFGRTAKLVAGAGAVSHAQKAMFQIGNFLIVLAVVLAAIMVTFRVYHDIVIANTWGLSDALGILQFVLILLVASIPVAMPAVFSITMALGALALSKRKAIVSRLEAIEEMAGVDILCTDKTGTLTKNQLKLGDPILLAAKDPQAVILAAALASKIEDRDAIDTAVIEALKDQSVLASYKQSKFVPFDPVTKRTAATVTGAQGKTIVVSKGAPEAIVELIKPAKDVADGVKKTVDDLADRGYRALGVARSDDNGATWALLGILPMFDPPRDDSKQTLDLVTAKGVRVKMITGDDTAIARETAPARHGNAHHCRGGRVPAGHGSEQCAAAHRRRDRTGGWLRAGVPRAQIRDCQGAAVARPPGRHDRRRRQRRAGAETGRLWHRGIWRNRRSAGSRRIDPHRAGAVGHQQRHRRGPADLRPHHQLHDLPRRVDHGHHVPGGIVDHLPRLPAADRNHDRHHVAFGRYPDHDDRL